MIVVVGIGAALCAALIVVGAAVAAQEFADWASRRFPRDD